MALTPKQFYEKYLGKGIDYDKSYGVQCVDGFKLVCHELGIPVKPTPNNWADGYFIYRNQLNYNRYFEYIYDPKQFKNGDWVIWRRGSKSHPSSHIAMYYQKKSFGQNQGGNRSFNLKATDFSDCMGALRPKVWGNIKDETTQQKTKTVNCTSVAKSFNKNLANTYKVSSLIGLNLRNGAGTNQKVLATLPYGQKVNCYGYYTESTGQKWLYVVTEFKSVKYTGFVSSAYLKMI